MYLMQEATAEEIAADDPFGGDGVFLSCALDGQEILAALERVLGEVLPAVAWPGLGAWISLRFASITPAEAIALWENSDSQVRGGC